MTYETTSVPTDHFVDEPAGKPLITHERQRDITVRCPLSRLDERSATARPSPTE